VIAEPDRDYINNYLYDLKKELKNLFIQAVINNIQINKEYYKKGIDKFTGKSSEKKMTFKIWLQKYIDDSVDRINPKTGCAVSYRTIQEYNTTFECIKSFEQTNKEPVDFETFDLNMLKDFRDYLTTEKKYAVNNIAKHLINVKQFLKTAYDEKYPVDADVINPKKFYIAKEEAFNVALNEQEIESIEALKLEGTQDLVRDLFLIGCNTGMRIFDFNNLKPHEIKEKFINIYQQKTGARVSIPINEKVKEILTKYNSNIPHITDKTIDQEIKLICKEAGIFEQIEKQQTKAGIRVSKVYPKYKLITAHTARRSFASNAIRNGYNRESVMRITGHKKESVFLKYVKLSDNDFGEMLQKHWECKINCVK
jgi:site-specific recombinase XerD